jgi:TRAP-type C4-dicarboxylate transport system permease small subunit
VEPNLRIFDELMKAVAAILVAATAVMTCAAVFYRFVLESSLGWPEEVAGLLLVWISFIGAYVATRENGHISFSLFVQRLPRAARKFVETMVDIILLVFFAVLAFQSIRMIGAVGHTEIETLDIPRGYFMAVLPISALALVVAYLLRLIRRTES